MVRSLTNLGHDLDVVIYDSEHTEVPANVRVFWREPVGTLRTLHNVVRHALLGSLSLNEAAYLNPGEIAFLSQLATDNDYELVIADMLRTAPLAAAAGRPLLIDMDDLLSERYTGYLKGNGGDKLLGYYGERLPAWMSTVLRKLARPALSWEARRLKKRELYWVDRADAVSLVSHVEARKLSQAANKKVLSLPMAVDPEDMPWRPDAEFVRDAVFVGGMDYQPNVEAVEWYRKEVEPHSTVTLDVIGACPDVTRSRLSSEGVRFVGYVDHLFEELRSSRVFVAPIISGSGIKTKVLEALAAGIPVVATSGALTGIGLVNGEHCLVADTGKQFAAALDNVLEAPEDARVRAERARELVASKYSTAAVCARWGEALQHALENRDQA